MGDTIKYFRTAYIVLVLFLLPLPFLLVATDFFVYGFAQSGQTTLNFLSIIVMVIAITIVGFTVFRKSRTPGEPKTKRFFPGLGLASLIAFFTDVFVYRLIYPLLHEEFRQFFSPWFYYRQTLSFGVGDLFLIYLGEIIMVLIIIVVGFTVLFKTSTPENPKSKLFLSRLGLVYLVWFLVSVPLGIFQAVGSALLSAS